MIKDHKVFVVSLPRTGTTSMCKMLNTIGYKAKHVPSCFYDKWAAEGFDAFADTPCFAPTFVKEMAITNPKNKFIYIEREPHEWLKSFESVKLDRSYNILLNIANPKDLNVVKINEIKAYGEAFGFGGVYSGDLFFMKYFSHRAEIFGMLPESRLLKYKFTDGWEPLCSFLNVPVPTEDLPALNKAGKIGESYANQLTTEGQPGTSL